jgi:ribosomal protein S18 acetylase RimI-like enzyme
MMSPSKCEEQVSRLEHLAFRGWPAVATRDVAGWRLRFSEGYTKRSNSINALAKDALHGPEIVERLEAPYLQLRQAPIWRLTPLAPLDMADLLQERRYRLVERSLMQVAPLLDRFAADPAVQILGEPTPAWIEAFCRYSPVQPAHREAMRRMLAAIAQPAGFALIEEAGRPLALAIGAAEDDHVGVFDVLVVPHARRRGLARRITESLYAWARCAGARFAYLQVVATNEAALALYASQGFRTAYTYEYRVPPAD